MKNWLPAIAMIAILFTSCKDTSAPGFTSFKINGTEIALEGATFSAGINDEATIQAILNDNDDLLQFIAYIDTTGVDDKERLYAKALSGREGFVEFTWDMRYVDSLGQRYYFGLPVPIIFTVLDNNTNTESVTVSFNVN